MVHFIYSRYFYVYLSLRRFTSCNAIAAVGTCVFPLVISGIIDASATRTPSTPVDRQTDSCDCAERETKREGGGHQ